MTTKVAGNLLPHSRHEQVLLLIIVLVYVCLGCLYAIKTPYWQSPDEPAHYNYVRYIAENGRLPELSLGDYPASYLEEIKAARFPSDMPISSIRYEAHQPPLYYLLATPIYWVTRRISAQPSPIPLRLFSVFLSTITLFLAYACVRTILPGSPRLCLGATAIAALIPQHLAISASINSDPLVELLIALAGLAILRQSGPWSWKRTILYGVLVGLGLLTKMQAYVTAGIVAVALLTDHRLDNRRLDWPQMVLKGIVVAGMALAVASPWIFRNMILYGWRDPLAMGRHGNVVVGQLTTGAYIGQHGLGNWLRNWFATTFRSFWGQFGWMGVPMPPRVYSALTLLSVYGLVGFAWWARPQIVRWHQHHPEDRRLKLILLAWALIPIAGYIWYNTQYVQHQGRYLFPGIVPLSLVMALGLDEIARDRPWSIIFISAMGLTGVLARMVVRQQIARFTTGLLLLGAGVALSLWQTERYMRGVTLLVVAVGLACLDIICLFQYIIPNLTP